MQDVQPVSQSALSAAVTARNTTKEEKKPRISKRLAQAIGLLVSGECKTQKAAAERANLRADYLSEALAKPHVRVFYERAARESIASGVMRAAARINSLVDASSEHVSFDAAKHVLGIAGIKPAADAQVSVNIDIKAGYVLDLRGSEGVQPFSDRMTLPNDINGLHGSGVNEALTVVPGDEPRHSPPAGSIAETADRRPGGKKR